MSDTDVKKKWSQLQSCIYKFARNDRAKSDPIYQIRYRAPYRDPSGRGVKHLHRGGGGELSFRPDTVVSCLLALGFRAITYPHDYPGSRLKEGDRGGQRGGADRGKTTRENEDVFRTLFEFTIN